jgi:hypothetical protein
MSQGIPPGAKDSAPDNVVPKIKWDHSKMHTSYANVVNATSTREEVSVFFGSNQTWNFDEQKEFAIELSNRIVLNPYAAKRLSVLLSRILTEYEKRFGELSLENAQVPSRVDARRD